MARVEWRGAKADARQQVDNDDQIHEREGTPADMIEVAKLNQHREEDEEPDSFMRVGGVHAMDI